MNSKTYPEHIENILRERECIPSKTSPQQAFREVCAWELGYTKWAEHIEQWVKDCGGRIVWPDKERE